jgi:hypothetical protein
MDIQGCGAIIMDVVLNLSWNNCCPAKNWKIQFTTIKKCINSGWRYANCCHEIVKWWSFIKCIILVVFMLYVSSEDCFIMNELETVPSRTVGTQYLLMLFLRVGSISLTVKSQTYVPFCIANGSHANQGDLLNGVYSRCCNQIFYDCVHYSNKVKTAPIATLSSTYGSQSYLCVLWLSVS